MKILSDLGGLSTSRFSNDNCSWVFLHRIDDLLTVLIDRETSTFFFELDNQPWKTTHFFSLFLSPFRSKCVHWSIRIIIKNNFLHLFLTHIFLFHKRIGVETKTYIKGKIETLLERDSIERKILQTNRDDNRGYQSFLAEVMNAHYLLCLEFFCQLSICKRSKTPGLKGRLGEIGEWR